MRNRVLFVCVLVSWLCGVGCQGPSKKPVVASKPVEVLPSRIFTLFWQQLVSLDWHSSNRTGARVVDKRVFSFSPAVEFDIYFPSNSPGSQSLDFVSSGEGGKGTLVGTDIRGYEAFALKFTLVSINGQSEPEMKQKLVAGALIGPVSRRQLRTYEPVTLGMAASEKTVIAKTPVSTDKIYQIGFHLHMLNPQDWDRSGSMVRLRIEPVVEPAEKPIEEPVKDGEEDIVPGRVPIKDAPNLLPVAEPNSVTTTEDTPVEISLIGSDPDSDPLAYSTITEPSHGSLIGTEPNLIYTPNPNFYGSDSFTFKVNDGTADSAPATVSIMVSPINDPPMAHGDTAETQEDMPIVRIDVLANDTDVDDDLLRIINVTQGKNGSVTINPDSTLAYSPHAKFYGSDVFTYTIADDKGLTDTAEVNVTVKMVNDAPV
ncbi:MAG: cadherin-like domain-containing protein, partial [Phycisphaerae bacterium]